MHTKKSFIRSIVQLFFSLLILLVISDVSALHAYADTTLDEVKTLVKNYYVEQVPDSVIDSAKSVDELLKSLGDPHTMYFTADEYKNFVDSINNSFVGIGIRIDMVPEGVKVVSVFEGSPAARVGLAAGDIITEADGKSLAGLTPDAATSYIKGAEGTSVHIKVIRNGSKLEFDVLRESISAPTVEGKMLDGGTAYIYVSSFGEDTAEQFGKMLDTLGKSSPENYIIDLRDNPGGYLITALKMAGFFTGSKPALIVRDKWGNQDTYYASGEYKIIDKPVVFLINGNSASASEILTSVVKDYKKAFIVGTKSYGKGTVQSMFSLSDGSVLKLTVEKFFSPLGNEINKVGIKPDIDTGDADALAAAQLLMGKSKSPDKTGFLKLEKDGRSFEINLSMARKPEYWPAFNKILESRSSGSKIMVGCKNGWTNVQDKSQNDLTSLYFPGYKSMADLNDVPVDKKFTVKFNANVDAESIKNEDVELINSETGERTELKFENIDSKTIRVIPKKPLEKGKKYYLIINNTIKGKSSQSMPQGAGIVINVK